MSATEFVVLLLIVGAIGIIFLITAMVMIQKDLRRTRKRKSDKGGKR